MVSAKISSPSEDILLQVGGAGSLGGVLLLVALRLPGSRTHACTPPPSHAHPTHAHTRPQTRTQTLYTIVNVATGTATHKAHLMERPAVLQGILGALAHANALIRIAAVWCIINLTWTDDSGSLERVAFLARYGFQERLEAMVTDANMDVRDPVLTALNHFKPLTADAGDAGDAAFASVMAGGVVMAEGAQSWPLLGPGAGGRGTAMDQAQAARRASGTGMDLQQQQQQFEGEGEDEDDEEDDEEDQGDYFDDAEEGY